MNFRDTIGYGNDSPVPRIASTGSIQSYVKAALARGMVVLQGICTTGGSPTSIVSTDLIGYGDNFFNNQFYMQIIQAGGAVPEGRVRKITDYTSTSGTFVCDTFTDNVDSGDELLIIHESLVAIGRNDADNVFDSSLVVASHDGSILERAEALKDDLIETVADLLALALADFDNFDVADADANTERWTPGYINGTEGGSADINTTVAGKLKVKVDPDATPTAAAYAAWLAQPITSKYFTVIVDVDATFGTPSGSWATTGIRISNVLYSANNEVYIQRQNSTAGVQNRIAAGATFNGASQGETYFTTTDSVLAFKIERWDNVFRTYYSLTQYPDYNWVFLAQFEDASEYLDGQVSTYLDAYSPGNADAETSQGDFGNFRLFFALSGIAQQIAGDYDSSSVASDADGSIIEREEYIQSLVDAVVAGRLQMKATTVDLQQAAGNYTLFTGATQDVVVEKLLVRLPNVDVSDDATITSISIQTNDATVQTFITSVQGAKANLTAEQQLYWTGAILLKATKLIRLTIAGGAADAPTVCDVVAEYRAVVSGGTL